VALTIGIPPTALRALYQPVGQLVVTWGIIDVTTASIVAIIFSRAGGKHKEKEVPRQIGRKVTFLRRCFRQTAAPVGWDAFPDHPDQGAF
jgi:hypothetical protein